MEKFWEGAFSVGIGGLMLCGWLMPEKLFWYSPLTLWVSASAVGLVVCTIRGSRK